jgi:hypothetical protein
MIKWMIKAHPTENRMARQAAPQRARWRALAVGCSFGDRRTVREEVVHDPTERGNRNREVSFLG